MSYEIELRLSDIIRTVSNSVFSFSISDSSRTHWNTQLLICNLQLFVCNSLRYSPFGTYPLRDSTWNLLTFLDSLHFELAHFPWLLIWNLLASWSFVTRHLRLLVCQLKSTWSIALFQQQKNTSKFAKTRQPNLDRLTILWRNRLPKFTTDINISIKRRDRQRDVHSFTR